MFVSSLNLFLIFLQEIPLQSLYFSLSNGQLKLITALDFHFTATHKLFIIELCSWGDEQSDGSACSPRLERLLIFPALRSDSLILPSRARSASPNAPLLLPRCLERALCVILRDIMYLYVVWVSEIKRWSWVIRGNHRTCWKLGAEQAGVRGSRLTNPQHALLCNWDIHLS